MIMTAVEGKLEVLKAAAALVATEKCVGGEYGKLLLRVARSLPDVAKSGDDVLVGALVAVGAIARAGTGSAASGPKRVLLGGHGGILSVVRGGQFDVASSGDGRLEVAEAFYRAVLKIPVAVDAAGHVTVGLRRSCTGRWVVVSKNDPSAGVPWEQMRGMSVELPGGFGVAVSGEMLANVIGHVHVFPTILNDGGCYLRLVEPRGRFTAFGELGMSPRVSQLIRLPSTTTSSYGRTADIEIYPGQGVHVATCGDVPTNLLTDPASAGLPVGGRMDHMRGAVDAALSRVSALGSSSAPSDRKAPVVADDPVGGVVVAHTRPSSDELPSGSIAQRVARRVSGTAMLGVMDVAATSTGMARSQPHGADACVDAWSEMMFSGGPMTFPACKQVMGRRPPTEWPPGESGVTLLVGAGRVDATSPTIRWAATKGQIPGWNVEIALVKDGGRVCVCLPPAFEVYVKYEVWFPGTLEVNEECRFHGSRAVFWSRGPVSLRAYTRGKLKIWRMWNESGSCGLPVAMQCFHAQYGDVVIRSVVPTLIRVVVTLPVVEQDVDNLPGTKIYAGDLLLESTSNLSLSAPEAKVDGAVRFLVKSTNLVSVDVSTVVLREMRGVVSWISKTLDVSMRVRLSAAARVRVTVVIVENQEEYLQKAVDATPD